MSPHFLPQDVYAEAMRGMIIVCTDAVITCQDKIWLAKRRAEPQSKIWVQGGRRPVGISSRKAIAKIWKRETGLDFHPERFSYILDVEYLWATRAQSPINTPCHTLSSIFEVKLSATEIAHVMLGLDPNEYDTSFGLQPFGMKELIEHPDTHPVLIDLARALGIP